MCGFIVTNKTASEGDIARANRCVQRRGPDATTVVQEGGFTFVHDLLSITGAFTTQPFVDHETGVVALFNGQIYNYLEFGQYASDGEALIPLYQKHGSDFVRLLDGEFALAVFDFTKGEFMVTTDVFATKPLWFANENGSIGIASYRSALTALGFVQPEKIPPNTTRIYRLAPGGASLVSTKTAFDFSLEQSVGTLDRFFSAFEAAVEKRTRRLREKIFIGLSSGYDSGALALAMTRLKVHFEAYSIVGDEDRAVLGARHTLLAYPPHLLTPHYADYLAAQLSIRRHAEPWTMSINPEHQNHNVLKDPGAIGIAYICSLAKKDGVKIYLSGQGSDEIIADYGRGGTKLASHSTFGGVFPDDLAARFPWRDFYGGAQEDYIAKEEHVAGAYGIEGRYPFLDKYFVQEFLSLTPALKNKEYKHPLAAYLRAHDYPFAEGVKQGFALGRFPLSERWSWRTALALIDA
jgi:asparagine synthetase B (glutamine-hydrolysing)